MQKGAAAQARAAPECRSGRAGLSYFFAFEAFATVFAAAFSEFEAFDSELPAAFMLLSAAMVALVEALAVLLAGASDLEQAARPSDAARITERAMVFDMCKPLYRYQ